MTEPYLYLEDLEKAKKPSARAPASAASPSSSTGKVPPASKVQNPGGSAGVKGARAPANPTPPKVAEAKPPKAPTTPKLTPEETGATDRVPCQYGGGAECRAHGGSGAKMHEAGGSSIQAHAQFQDSPDPTKTDEEGDKQQADAPTEEPVETKASGRPEEGQAPEKQLVSSGGGKGEPVSSSQDKIDAKGKPSATSIEAEKRGKKGASSHAEDLKAFKDKNPDWQKKQFIENKTFEQHFKQSKQELAAGDYAAAQESAAKAAYLQNFLKDHPSATSSERRDFDDLVAELADQDSTGTYGAIDKVVETQESGATEASADAKASKDQEGNVDAYREKEKAAGRTPYQAGPPSGTTASDHIDNKKAEMQETGAAEDKAAEVKAKTAEAKETRDSEKHEADMKHKAAQTAQVEAKTKEVGKPTPTASEPAAKKPRSRTYKKNTKKDPKGTQSSFGYGDKEKPAKKTKTEAKKPEAKKPSTSKDKKDPQLRLDFGKENDPETAANKERRARLGEENVKNRAAFEKQEADKPPKRPVAAKPAAEQGNGKGKKPKKANYGTLFDRGRLAGTRLGEAAATAEAGGYLLSGGIEYGIGGAVKVGQHLLHNKDASGKARTRDPSRKPSTPRTSNRGSEVNQSSMKSLPLYLDLFKAVQSPNAGNITPDEGKARRQHESSYAKRPVGVANEGIVTEDDPEVGRKWKHSDDDSVLAEVDEDLKAKKEEEEEEDTQVDKGLDPVAFLKDMNSKLTEEVGKSLPNTLEASFMREELGYDPINISNGQAVISGRNRSRFNRWAHDRLSKSISSFSELVK